MAKALESPSTGESLAVLRIPTLFISVFCSVFRILAPSGSCSFVDNGLETVSPLSIDVTDVALSDFKVRRGELPMDKFWSAGDEEGVWGNTGMVSNLEPAVRAGEGVRACNGLALFPKDEDGTGDWLDIAWPDGKFGLGVRAGGKSVFVASDGIFLELSLGLGVTHKGEVGVFNEETEDGVLIWDEDGGDEPKLIKAMLARNPGSRSWPELGSGGVWVTGKPVLE